MYVQKVFQFVESIAALLVASAECVYIYILWAALSSARRRCRHRGGRPGTYDALVLRSGGVGPGWHDLTRLQQLLCMVPKKAIDQSNLNHLIS